MRRRPITHVLIFALLFSTSALSKREHVPGDPRRDVGTTLGYPEFQKLLSDEKLRKAFASCPLYDPAGNGATHRGKHFWYVRALGAHLTSDEFRRQEAPAIDFFVGTVFPDLKKRAMLLAPPPKDLAKLLVAMEKAFALKSTSSVPLKQIIDAAEFKTLYAALGDPPWKGEWEEKKKNLAPVVKVGVLDTGLDASHPMFEGRVPFGDRRSNSEEKLKLGLFGPTEITGHGTHVAGTILILGYNTEIVSVPMLGENAFTTERAYQIAIDDGVKITNGSWGFDSHDDHDSKLFRKLMTTTTRQGSIHIMAAGNSGNQNRAVEFYPGSVSTGSVDESGNRSWFSQNEPDFASYGELLFAPKAGGIPAPLSEEEKANAKVSIEWNGQPAPLIGMRGTSMASPALTGVATTALSIIPDLHREELFPLLAAASEDLNGLGKDISTGRGMPNSFLLFRLTTALKEWLAKNPGLKDERDKILTALADKNLLESDAAGLEKQLAAMVAKEAEALKDILPQVRAGADKELVEASSIL